ncbi:MAG: UDP-N-acetylmuramoyl-L-alanyl-D-glutamate--2,6-diaminopimelate ligase [Lachnospiraceae bacterium]|nr:UDP-N-acetylmuramoyl-L-alanyl-D-glutamate--2,6-diaminopimelate ligase [Lachnospiraceae bacterium]
MKLEKILEKTEYTLLSGSLDTDIDDIVYDSRKAKEGTAFVCMTGAQADGHKFIQGAVDNGTKVIIIEHEVDMIPGVTYIQMDDTRAGLAYMSAALFEYPAEKLTVIGLTGTKGKTTTTFMIKSILEKAGKKVGIIGTIGVFMGEQYIQTHNTTPESYDIQYYFKKMADMGCDTVVMEVSSQALKLNRTAGIMFDYAIYTNLSPDHIGENEHKNMEEYIYCKSLLFKQCRHGIFNVDDEHSHDMMQGAVCDITTYGFDKKADLIAGEVKYLIEPGFIGIEYESSGIIDGNIKVNTPGKFSAYNSMAAMCVASFMRAEYENMLAALNEVAVRGRVEPVKISDRFNLLIDYAHNAMSLESLLTTIKDYEPGRIVCLFGCGGNRSKLRRYEMGEISGKYADLSVITADNSRYEDVMDIIEDIKMGIHKTTGKYVVIPDRKEAIKYCIENAKDGDIILLCGKGHEDYQEINGERHPFDERVIINEILTEIDWKG